LVDNILHALTNYVCLSRLVSWLSCRVIFVVFVEFGKHGTRVHDFG